jgi:hypothetical protein
MHAAAGRAGLTSSSTSFWTKTQFKLSLASLTRDLRQVGVLQLTLLFIDHCRYQRDGQTRIVIIGFFSGLVRVEERYAKAIVCYTWLPRTLHGVRGDQPRAAEISSTSPISLSTAIMRADRSCLPLPLLFLTGHLPSDLTS